MSDATRYAGAFTVMVTLKVPVEQQEEILRLAESNVPIFAQQPGFLSAQLYRSHDGTRILTCLRWASQADHEACMQSPDWAQCDPQFHVLLDRGIMEMDVRTYRPVCVHDAAEV